MTAETLILLLGAVALLAGLLHMPRPVPVPVHRSEAPRRDRPARRWDWDDEDDHQPERSSGGSLFGFMGGSMQDDRPISGWDDEDE